MHPLLLPAGTSAIPVHCVARADWPTLRDGLAPVTRSFAQAQGFAARPGQHVLLPDAAGSLSAVLLGVEPASTRRRDPFVPGRLATTLPPGDYALAGDLGDPALAALGLGSPPIASSATASPSPLWRGSSCPTASTARN